MQVTAIIAEWNPLHRGHLLPVQAARQQGATHIAAILSGNFVQRGEPALCPWQYRAAAALSSGVDLVLQLPLPYAVSTAQHFAEGAVASLAALGAVDSLIFGSECGELAALRSVAAALDSPDLPAALAPHLQKGLPFAAARQAAVHSLLGEDAGLLSSPNNILGIEYLRALRRLGSNIQPLTISRQGAPHDAAEPDTDFPSASQLRQRFLTGQDISSSLPPAMAEQLELARQRGALPQLELWERAFLARLRAMTETDYAALPDVTEGLEHRLYRASRTAKTTEELLAEAKTKRYTHARLRRVLLAAMLELPAGLSTVEPPYLRVLGFTAKGAEDPGIGPRGAIPCRFQPRWRSWKRPVKRLPALRRWKPGPPTCITLSPQGWPPAAVNIPRRLSKFDFWELLPLGSFFMPLFHLAYPAEAGLQSPVGESLPCVKGGGE